MLIANFSLQNVQPKAGTATTEQPASHPGEPAAPGGGPGNGPLGSLLGFAPLLVLPILFFMMFRRQKKESEARGKLKKGDRVLTNGGLIGELVEVDAQIAKIRIAPGTTVQVLASTLSPYDADAASKAAS